MQKSENNDVDELEFGAMVLLVAERKFAASTDDAFDSYLYREYIKDGKPHGLRKWLEARLGNYFKWVDQPPKWIEKNKPWPFYKGRPMVFLRQFQVPKFSFSDGTKSPNATLYIFCAKVNSPSLGGWTTLYKIVEQDSDIAKAGL